MNNKQNVFSSMPRYDIDNNFQVFKLTSRRRRRFRRLPATTGDDQGCLGCLAFCHHSHLCRFFIQLNLSAIVDVVPVSILDVSCCPTSTEGSRSPPSPEVPISSSSEALTKMPRLHSTPEVGSSVAFSISSLNTKSTLAFTRKICRYFFLDLRFD